MPFTDAERAFVASAGTGRTATLATVAPDGRPRLVPVCFVLLDDELFTPIDDKPKAGADPRTLARIRDIERRPDVTLLIDRWDEDWSRLAWLRIGGTAEILDRGDECPAALTALRAKYGQYAEHDLEGRPLIRVRVASIGSWGALSDRGRPRSPSGGGSGSSSSPGDSRPR